MYVVGYGRPALKIGPGDIRKQGEPVPEAEKWKPNVLQSHLNMKHLMLEEEYKIWKAQADKRTEELKKRRQERNGLLPKTEQESEGSEEEQSQDVTEGGDSEGSGGEGGSDESGSDGDSNSIEGPNDSDKPLEYMSKAELKEVAQSIGLAVRGNKQELMDRIKNAEEQGET